MSRETTDPKERRIRELEFPADEDWKPEYEKWRHGGWYVWNLRFPNGAIGCVSRNFPDRKWRIVCDPRPFDEQPTFRTRDEAARAERGLVRSGKFGYGWRG